MLLLLLLLFLPLFLLLLRTLVLGSSCLHALSCVHTKCSNEWTYFSPNLDEELALDVSAKSRMLSIERSLHAVFHLLVF